MVAFQQPVVLVLFSPLMFLLNSCSSQVVGWPPIRSYRMNSLVNQTKLPATEEFNSLIGNSKNSNTVVGKATNNCIDKNNGSAKENGRCQEFSVCEGEYGWNSYWKEG